MTPTSQLSREVCDAILQGQIAAASPWVDMAGAIAHTGYSRNTIIKWRNWGLIVEYKVPGSSRSRFKKSELDHVIQCNDPDDYTHPQVVQPSTAGSPGDESAS